MTKWYSHKDVPVFGEIENPKHMGDFDVTISPLGFRHMWVLGGIAKRLPFQTGTPPQFNIKVKGRNIDSGLSKYYVSLHRVFCSGKEPDFIGAEAPYFEDGTVVDWDFTDDPLIHMGEYSYDLSIHVGAHENKVNILSLEVISQDRLIYNLLLGVMIAVISSVISVLLTLAIRH